mmetsp:Transcript_388/g.399  ORF Transcript_388/g.399 Transcript_388/m.399 type:complete len:220 (-) Transcript_388:3936-4595(-)
MRHLVHTIPLAEQHAVHCDIPNLLLHQLTVNKHLQLPIQSAHHLESMPHPRPSHTSLLPWARNTVLSLMRHRERTHSSRRRLQWTIPSREPHLTVSLSHTASVIPTAKVRRDIMRAGHRPRVPEPSGQPERALKNIIQHGSHHSICVMLHVQAVLSSVWEVRVNNPGPSSAIWLDIIPATWRLLLELTLGFPRRDPIRANLRGPVGVVVLETLIEVHSL